ncbi:syntaxin-binding protein 6 isoform X3 [Siniperca chuatsi]|uniref:syntaxin-binding protein 6 isoform X3 n=1 Tax=Siniperca chuatsi TaxID=119488 RepID=UPI001CE23081|nr:syntaxin-binding protein 6 isoform X3 [Siniperca chuatsi]
MSAKSAINKEVFIPHNEKMLAAVQVKRRTKKKIPFLATGGQGDYMTFICLSVMNKKPSHLSITKVKQFQGSSSFIKRSQWTIDQLRQVNGIDPNKDCPEFDLMFENAFDQWVAGSAGEKCTFIQILHHTCQRYSSARKPEFVNCQSKLLGVHDLERNLGSLLSWRWMCRCCCSSVSPGIAESSWQGNREETSPSQITCNGQLQISHIISLCLNSIQFKGLYWHKSFKNNIAKASKYILSKYFISLSLSPLCGHVLEHFLFSPPHLLFSF